MRRNGFTFVEFVTVVAIVVICAVILLPVFTRQPHYGGNARLSSCRTNLKQIGLGFKQYSQDYGDKFPPVAVVRSGYWAGSIQPYLKSWQIFQCPSGKKFAVKKTDYFYNSRLAQIGQGEVSFATQTILAGEGRDDSSTSYSLQELPDAWLNTEALPARRHSGVASYLFADGHTKYLKPDQISIQSPAQQVYTFAIR